MVSNYVLFPKAQDDLEKIFRYISNDLGNNQAVAKLTVKFEKKFNELMLFPESYPIIKNKLLKEKSLRKCFVDNFLIIYLYNIHNKRIEIVRIIYARRDYLKDPL